MMSGLQTPGVRYKTLPELVPNVLTFCCVASGDRARPEALRCGHSAAAQVERETAILRGGLPARCGCLPVLGAPVHQRLQET